MATISNEPLLLVHDENAGSSEETPSLVLNSRNLSSVLGGVGNRPISIISLVGPEKSGKSVVFGYMVKYLTAAEQDDPDWIDTNDKSKPLDDLKWGTARQNSPDTPGIWCFNRPFILNVGDDCNDTATKEVAVILLYTQTSDKGKWSGKDDATTAALAGLSILASSSTIFNVNKYIDEKCLSAVSSCIARAMQGVKFPGKRIQPLIPFQNATFLIRDWSYPTEYPFGMSGGRDYVRLEKLREKLAQSRDSRMNRQVTTSVFENVSACLLPYPGNAAVKPSFKGSVGEMDVGFVETLKDFIEEVIDVNRLVLKKDAGKAGMTVAEWKVLLNEYINEVNGGANGDMKGERLLRFLGVKRNVLQGEQKEYIKVALKAYGDIWKKYGGGERKSGKEKEPDEIHKLGKKRAMKAFQNEICPQADNDGDGDSDGGASQQKVDKKVEKLLKEKLEEKYVEMKAIKERRQAERMEKLKEDMIEQYTESMMTAFQVQMEGRAKSAENSVKKESKEVMETLKGEFLAKIGALGGKEQDVRDFENRLDQAEMKFLGKLFHKPEAKSEDFGKSGESFSLDFGSRGSADSASSTSAFKSITFGEFNGNPINSPKKTLNTNNVNKPLEEWGRVERNVGYEGHGRGRGRKQLDNQTSSQTKTREQQRLDEERLKEKAKKLINSLKDSHTINLMKKLEEGGAGDLESFHLYQMKEVMEQFAEQIQFPAKSQDFNLYKSILEDDLRSALASVKSKSRQQSRSKQQNLAKAMKEACINFEQKLESYLEDNGGGEDDGGELKQVGKKIMESELEILNEKFGSADVMNVREEVTKDMFQIFERLKERNERGRMVTVQQSKRMITELKAKYLEAMKTVGVAKNLMKEHNSLKKKILDDFRKESPIREQKKILNEQANELGEGLEQCLKEIQTRLKMQMDGETGTQLMEVQKAIQFYSGEMDKHFKNHDFILEAALLKIHKKVCDDTMKKFPTVQQHKLKESLEEAFIKYQEENQMNMNVEPAIGIDLGTTFSCVSVYQKGQIKIIPNSVGTLTTPSYVLFQASGEEIVGVPAKERAYENPEGTIFDSKRILGRKFDDEKLQEDMRLWPFTVVDGGRGVPMIQVNGKKFNPEMIAAKILEQLKRDSEAYLKRPVTKAVITVPAYFTDGQKQATMDAGEMAGLKVLSILTEPVAAAMAYKLQYSHGSSGDRHILIFDLGGGTFDVAVLKTSKGHIEVLTVDGDTHLGGEDFDRNMMNYCAQEFKKKHKVDLFDGKDSVVKSVKDDVRRRLKRLQGECERQKINLSSGSARSADVRIECIYEKLDLEVTVSKATFEKINKTLFDTTIEVVKKALKDAKLEKGQIDEIVLVGGSTRIPKIQSLLKEFFGKELDKKINPDEAVAHGAGLMAAIKKGNVGKGEAAYTKIQDVTPMPIGVEVYGGGFSAIIPKSTKIPVKLEERYKTAHNNQTSVQITIYEGEDPVAVKNKHLGDFYLNGIPPKEAGEENIDVEMVINDQGILHVTAKCSSTGTKNTVTVTENKQRMGQQTIKRYIAERRKAA